MTHTISTTERSDKFLLTGANLLIETNTYGNRHLAVQPQHERLPAHIDAFRWINSQYGAKRTVSVLGLQELQVDDTSDNGEVIQTALGNEFGMWHPHSRKSHGEHIGATSNVLPDSAEAIKLDKNRYAIAMRFGEFCVCVAHPMYSDAKRRAKQTDALIEYLADETYSALIADFNEEPWPLSTRKKLGTIGMRSAFVRSNQNHPVTIPTAAYKQNRSLPRRIGFELLGGGLRFDDIYISDAMNVHTTGTIESDSDHRFVYAAVSTPAGVNRLQQLT